MSSLSKIAISSDNSWSKWQVALVVTAPVAFGLGFLYFYKRRESKNPVISNNVEKAKKCLTEKKKNAVEKSVPNSSKVMSPIQKAEEIKNKGNVFFKNGEYENAIQCYTDAIKLCPTYEKHTLATFYQNRAAAYERMEKMDCVISDCTEALKLNARYIKALVRRAKACEKLDNLDLALEDLAVVTMIENYQNQENVIELERIAQKSGRRCGETFLATHAPQLPSKYFVKTYLSTFKHGSALDKLDPDNETDAEYIRKYKEAEECLMCGRCKDAEELCDELIQVGETLGNITMKMEAVLLRGTLYTLSKQNDKAIVDLTNVANNEEADSRVRINALLKRSTVYQHTGEPEKCCEDFSNAEKIDENNPDIYHHHGQIYLITDRLAESVNSFRKAAALDPEFSISAIQHVFAEYKYAIQQADEENKRFYFAEFKNILERFPESVECKTLYAQILVEKQEYSEAEVLFDLAIKQEPDHAALFVHKALLILQWKADIDAAKSLIKRAIRLDKDCEFAYETIATIEMQLGDYRAAVKYFDEAIARYTSQEELFHLFCVRNTANAQIGANDRLGLYSGSNVNGIH